MPVGAARNKSQADVYRLVCLALQTAEAAEDAELLILASDPALRQTLDPSESSTAEAYTASQAFSCLITAAAQTQQLSLSVPPLL